MASAMLLPHAEQRRLLIKIDALEELGKSRTEICEILALTKGDVISLRKREIMIYSVAGPWQRVYRGKRWTDMPGCDWFSQRCNFALYRRGFEIFDQKRHGVMKPMGLVKRRGRPPKKVKLDPESVEGAIIEPSVPELAW